MIELDEALYVSKIIISWYELSTGIQPVYPHTVTLFSSLARVLISLGDYKNHTRVMWENIAESKVVQIPASHAGAFWTL